MEHVGEKKEKSQKSERKTRSQFFLRKPIDLTVKKIDDLKNKHFGFFKVTNSLEFLEEAFDFFENSQIFDAKINEQNPEVNKKLRQLNEKLFSIPEKIAWYDYNHSGGEIAECIEKLANYVNKYIKHFLLGDPKSIAKIYPLLDQLCGYDLVKSHGGFIQKCHYIYANLMNKFFINAAYIGFEQCDELYEQIKNTEAPEKILLDLANAKQAFIAIILKIGYRQDLEYLLQKKIILRILPIKDQFKFKIRLTTMKELVINAMHRFLEFYAGFIPNKKLATEYCESIRPIGSIETHKIHFGFSSENVLKPLLWLEIDQLIIQLKSQGIEFGRFEFPNIYYTGYYNIHYDAEPGTTSADFAYKDLPKFLYPEFVAVQVEGEKEYAKQIEWEQIKKAIPSLLPFLSLETLSIILTYIPPLSQFYLEDNKYVLAAPTPTINEEGDLPAAFRPYD